MRFAEGLAALSHCALRVGPQRARSALPFRTPLPAAMGADAAELRGRVWSLAQTAHGTWVVQNALDTVSDDSSRLQLVHELKSHTWEALRCPHANHVLQKCVTTVRASAAQFIVDELLAPGPGAIVWAAKHQYGCRVVQRILEHLSAPQVAEVVQELAVESAKLSKHTYGNYAIRSLLEHYPGEAHRTVSLAIGLDIETTMRSRYGSAVVADALIWGAEEDQLALAHALVADGAWLHRVGRSGGRHLPTIARRMVELLSMDQIKRMCDGAGLARWAVASEASLSCADPPAAAEDANGARAA